MQEYLDIDNENQSKNRVNWVKISGLRKINPLIKPVNSERLIGGYAAVFYNGNTTETQSTKTGGSNDNPSGGGDDPSNPPFKPEPFDPKKCDTVKIGDIFDMLSGDDACNIKGKNCKTGENENLNTRGNTENNNCDGSGCNSGGENNSAWVVYFYSSKVGGKSYYICGNAAAALSIFEELKGEVDSGISGCGETEILSDDNTITDKGGSAIYFKRGINCNNNQTITLQARVSFSSHNCTGLEQCVNPKKSYIENGLIVSCDDKDNKTECMTMCDENGDTYTICVDENGDITVSSNGKNRKIRNGKIA